MKRVGFIGAGRWATPYALAVKSAGGEAGGIYAPDDSAVKLAEKCGGQVIDDPRKVIEDSDLVLIGSPSDTHADYVEMAAECGKTVLCASPVAVNELTLGRVRGVADRVQGFCSLPMRWRGEFQKLKSTLKSGDLGTTGMIRLGICKARPDGWRSEEVRSGGILAEDGVHLLDLLEWLEGPIERIHGEKSVSADSGKEYVLAVARMQSGAIAHLELSWAEPQGIAYDYYEVAGSNGILEFDSRREPLMVIDEFDGERGRVVYPGATCAETELRAVLAGGEGCATIAEGAALAERALTLVRL